MNKINLVNPSFEDISLTSHEDAINLIESAYRVCYQSNMSKSFKDSQEFIKKLIKVGHLSPLEHYSITLRLNCSKSLTHQLVRHRIGSYSQKSSRWVNLAKKPPKFIIPPTIKMEEGVYEKNGVDWYLYGAVSNKYWSLLSGYNDAYEHYRNLVETEGKEIARYCLPDGLETEIVVTYNLRQWRHVLKERALNKHASPEMQYLFGKVLKYFKKELPTIFGDLK